MACTGTESRLIGCSYDSHTADCSHSEDAAVYCSLCKGNTCYVFVLGLMSTAHFVSLIVNKLSILVIVLISLYVAIATLVRCVCVGSTWSLLVSMKAINSEFNFII